MKRFFILLLLLIFTFTGYARLNIREQIRIRQIINDYQRAINSGNFEYLDHNIAQDFRFGDNTADISRVIVNALFTAQVFEIRNIGQISTYDLSDSIIIEFKVIIHTYGAETETIDKMVLVYEDEDIKIKSLGVGTLQAMVIKDPVKDLNVNISGDNLARIRFADNPTHILIPVKIPSISKDELFYFILDSGAPLTIISTPYAELFEKFSNNARMLGKAQGVGGEINSTNDFRIIDSMYIGNILLEDIKALTVDLSHLEDALGRKFIGLIGTDIIGKFITTIDYSEKEIIFMLEDAETPEELKCSPAHAIHFEQKLHLVIVQADLPAEDGGRFYADIAIDSGAGAGLLSPGILEKIPSEYTVLGDVDTLMGAGSEVVLSEIYYIDGLDIEGVTRNGYPVVKSDISHLSMGSGNAIIDGLIGLNFFDNYLITLDYKRKVMELRTIPKED